jgi:hypothetical protein
MLQHCCKAADCTSPLRSTQPRCFPLSAVQPNRKEHETPVPHVGLCSVVRLPLKLVGRSRSISPPTLALRSALVCCKRWHCVPCWCVANVGIAFRVGVLQARLRCMWWCDIVSCALGKALAIPGKALAISGKALAIPGKALAIYPWTARALPGIASQPPCHSVAITDGRLLYLQKPRRRVLLRPGALHSLAKCLPK